jgi:hypothetical protein
MARFQSRSHLALARTINVPYDASRARRFCYAPDRSSRYRQSSLLSSGSTELVSRCACHPNNTTSRQRVTISCVHHFSWTLESEGVERRRIVYEGLNRKAAVLIAESLKHSSCVYEPDARKPQPRQCSNRSERIAIVICPKRTHTDLTHVGSNRNHDFESESDEIDDT